LVFFCLFFAGEKGDKEKKPHQKGLGEVKKKKKEKRRKEKGKEKKRKAKKIGLGAPFLFFLKQILEEAERDAETSILLPPSVGGKRKSHNNSLSFSF
jgi:Na+/citrate or Na+/malate symporter